MCRTASTLGVTRLECCELFEVIFEIQKKAHLFPINLCEKKRTAHQKEPS